MSLYERVADLEIVVDEARYERLEQATARFTRVSTVVVLAGAGAEGRGEDVNYDATTHDALPDLEALELRGRHTLRSLSARLEAAERYPADPAPAMYAPDYRRWAFESAALDLALRQAGMTLGEALGLPYAPVRFAISSSLPPEDWLAIDPDLEFKLDATADWTREHMEALAATDRVRVVDLKGFYEGTVVDNPPDRRLYTDVVECFGEAVIEDARFTDETRDVLMTAAGRLAFDAPVHSLADLRALPVAPRWCNVKPSRFGSLERLFECIDACRAEGIAMYGGGQFELGPGRFQLQALASLLYPSTPNDVAPGVYNAPEVRAGLPRSPLPVPDDLRGFAFGDH